MFSTIPIDAVDKQGEWLVSYRFEPFLDKWFMIDPLLPAKLRLLDTENVPEQVLSAAAKRTDLEVKNAYQSPNKLQIQLNTSCNYSCPMCYALGDKVKSREDDLTLDELKGIFREAKESGVIRVNFVGGEVFMRKDFEEIIDAAIDEKLLISCITNARIPGSQIESFRGLLKKFWNIQVSCNGIGKSYEKEYGIKDWNKSKQAIKAVIENTRANILSFVITKDNVEDIPSFIDFASSINPTLVKFGSLCWSGRSKGLETTNYYKSILPRAKELINKGREKHPNMSIQSQIDRGEETPMWLNYNNDYRPFEFYFAPEARDGVYVTSEGDIYPFALLADRPELKVGNIREDSIKSLWENSELLKRIRQVGFRESECGKLGCKKVCGLWSRSYAIAWSGKLDGKVPCELTSWVDKN